VTNVEARPEGLLALRRRQGPGDGHLRQDSHRHGPPPQRQADRRRERRRRGRRPWLRTGRQGAAITDLYLPKRRWASAMPERPHEFASTPEDMVARVRLRGGSVPSSPMLNRGTAFTLADREPLGLTGLLPTGMSTMDGQLILAAGPQAYYLLPARVSSRSFAQAAGRSTPPAAAPSAPGQHDRRRPAGRP
jgi:hypothetical protein